MISATGLSFAYDRVAVLRDAGLDTGTDRVVGLIGPNGSGKTTLLRLLYRSLAPGSGAVLIDGAPLSRVRGRDLARRIAVVTQENTSDLPITVAEMVLLGRSPHRSSFRSWTTADRDTAARALHRVDLRDHAERPFVALSGGEKQRVLIARALAQQAGHLLLDEPTNHLDVHHQHEVLALVRTLRVPTVVVLHDLNLAARYCDHVVLLDRGSVVRAGTPAEVLVPEVLEPVYRVVVRVLDDDDCIQLVFRPGP
jgi:iron complex transport system ATP-binding protein